MKQSLIRNNIRAFQSFSLIILVGILATGLLSQCLKAKGKPLFWIVAGPDSLLALVVTPSSELNNFTVGGTVSGLGAGDYVDLQINGGEILSVNTNSSFVFTGTVVDNSSYNVLVAGATIGLWCVITSGGGTISGSNISNVVITCSIPGT